MSSFDSRGDPAARPAASPHAEYVPASCPACHSRAVVTKAKRPDASSYWRCLDCGEMWNVTRPHVTRSRTGR